MKILLISNMYPSKDNPTYGTFVKTFEVQMIEENFTLDKVIITRTSNSSFQKIKKYIIFIFKTYKEIKKNNYDMIYVHYIGHSLLPFLLYRNKDKLLLINAHGGDVLPTNLTKKLIQKLVIPIVNKADYIISPSEYLKNIIVDKYNIKEKNIFISPSGGINRELFKPISIQKNTKLFTLGFVSRIEINKGFDTLLDAFEIIIKKHKNIKLIIIGGGSEEDKLKRRIHSNDKIEYVGAIAHDKLPFYFNKMDLFIFPTKLQESLGLVGLEAMACSIPVIGSNIGGLKSYIKNDYNGQLFEMGNYKKLAMKIDFFLNMETNKFNEYKKNALNTTLIYDSNIVKKKLANKIKSIVRNNI